MITPEQLAKYLENTFPDNLVSVVLYGSAASEDNTKLYSDVNVLLVVKNAGLETLNAIKPVVKHWCKQKNPAPLLLDLSAVEKGQDVFAIEFTDIQSSHRVLFGTNPFDSLVVDPRALRQQLEFELRAKLMLLQKKYLEWGDNDKELQQLIGKSFSSFSVLAKTILRLMKKPVPLKKKAAWDALGEHLSIDLEVIDSIIQLREGDKAVLKQDPRALFGRYLELILKVMEFVDTFDVEKSGGK